MIYRLILPEWASGLGLKKVLEGEFTDEQIKEYNSQGYNVYYLPNTPSIYNPGVIVEGAHIDIFRWVFVDMDLKQAKYPSKEAFLEKIGDSGLFPSKVVDSGNGIHVYWKVVDLDAMSYLRFQRRLMRLFDTDEAVAKIYQLMRVPGTYNTKDKDNPKLCEQLYYDLIEYTSEHLDSLLPIITAADEEYCKQHFNKTYSLDDGAKIDDKIPVKFAKLIQENQEVKDIWSGKTEDRSKSDYRLGHLMFANSFTKEEALSVLVNSAKALERAPKHRVNYAQNIVDKIWVYELSEDKNALTLSKTVKEILEKSGEGLKGTRFPCYRYLDATEHGFRLGQVIGLVAGSGVGKTAMALNMFMGFVQSNPDYEHFFIPLEQPANEIADRWKTLCGDNTILHEKVHVISNYDEDGSFRHLSFEEIKDYLLKFQASTGKKVGCVVIDHIGALKKKGKDGENQDLMDICHSMKAFAIQTNTLLVMQSQAPREKAGIGDLELNKDAAYGTVYFESYCDYLITIWQPLKRCYPEGSPKITAYKFCKIRHKKTHKDEIQEDVRYLLRFDPETERFSTLTQDEAEKEFVFWNNKATNLRKQDRKTDILTYSSITWSEEGTNGAVNNDSDARGTTPTQGVSSR